MTINESSTSAKKHSAVIVLGNKSTAERGETQVMIEMKSSNIITVLFHNSISPEDSGRGKNDC